MPNTKRPAGPTLTPRAGLAAPSNGTPVNGSTVVPPYQSNRVVASYKIDAAVKQDFARYVKRLNRDKEPNEETEIGAVAEAALREYMARHGEG